MDCDGLHNTDGEVHGRKGIQALSGSSSISDLKLLHVSALRVCALTILNSPGFFACDDGNIYFGFLFSKREDMIIILNSHIDCQLHAYTGSKKINNNNKIIIILSLHYKTVQA